MPTGKLSIEHVERFLYWIQERHTIHTIRELGYTKPWTADPVLLDWFFTNPYREHDKTTQWFKNNLREPLRDDPRVAFATVAFRWLNYIPTGMLMCGMASAPPKRKFFNPTPNGLGRQNYFIDWDRGAVNRMLRRLADADIKVFTGAYMIKLLNATPKVDAVCQMIDNVWRDRDVMVKYLEDCTTLEQAWKFFGKYPYIAGFNAYEIVTDLRHTYLLENATDINLWANLGPGGSRGLYRVCGMEPVRKPWLENWQALMLDLLKLANKRFAKPIEIYAQSLTGHGTTTRLYSPPKKKGKPILPATLRKGVHTEYGIEYLQTISFPTLEMREIEHSLCEYDKYERARDIAAGVVRTGSDDSGSKMKRRYTGRR